ncbi:hypothetical protein VCR26J2_380092 [Vibrio coralliirubri]|uniref:hypothetical protein n=1 Tax=Vibrio coralliirubri TaxID=1516159 RepID=UPI000631E7A6|nr:hypothetical protein [Vibrio coralliirubri]CDT81349.1 hypothetical protein VCR26J2_380092 [Vibrio coralliirubri]
MNGKDDLQSWLTKSKTQEQWAKGYLLKKAKGLSGVYGVDVARSWLEGTSAQEFLKGLSVSDISHRELLRSARSAWRTKVARKKIKHKSVSISNEIYSLVELMSKSRNSSIKNVVENLLNRSVNDVHMIQQAESIKDKFDNMNQEIERLDKLVEELETKHAKEIIVKNSEINELKLAIEKMNNGNQSLDAEEPKAIYASKHRKAVGQF